MLVSDMASRIKRLFGDESGTQIVDTDIYAWISDAQDEIVRQNQNLLQTTAVADSVVGQNTYTLPSDIMTLVAIEYNGVRIKGLNLSDFEIRYNGWDVTNGFPQGTPCIYHTWAGNFTVFPTPDTAITSGIKIYYTKKPATITTGTDPISLPSQYHKTIVDLCLAQAYELDEDLDSATFKANKAQQDIDNLKNDANLGETISYPTITVLEEDY